MREIKISMCCVNCRSSEYVRETGGNICRKHKCNIDNSWPCEDFIPSKQNVRVWIARAIKD